MYHTCTCVCNLQHGAHVSFLHEELLKLPSFPRKALEADFGLYGGDLGKVIVFYWTQLFDYCTSGDICEVLILARRKNSRISLKLLI